MDSLTHSVIGACVGDAIGGKKIGKKAMLWGALANNLPDIDVFTSLWMNQADSLCAHRGFTHSLLFALIASPLLAWLFSRGKSKLTFREWLLIFGTGNFIHIFIDAFTAYGTGWFEPFTHDRVSMNLIFVADPFFTIGFLISAIALLVIKSHSHGKRRKWRNFAFLLWGAYMIMASSFKFIDNNRFKLQLAGANVKYDSYFTTPAPLQSFLWYNVAKIDSGYLISYYSVLDKENPKTLTFKPDNARLLDSLPSTPEMKKLVRFSKGYFTLENHNDTLYFSDIRFGQAGGWYNPQASFVFRYILNTGANNDLVIQRGRFEGSMRDGVRTLWERVVN
ncbi:MAG: metal-dependent hydrolase [Bacteroidia bacterium]